MTDAALVGGKAAGTSRGAAAAIAAAAPTDAADAVGAAGGCGVAAAVTGRPMPQTAMGHGGKQGTKRKGRVGRGRSRQR